ncbi:MAG: MFS transporter [Rikenellaceae bacterium]|nr:MFS transporter [Rikenellaceae bacterium]MCL2692983.1 MFS transporter [Rikenellaceae bacterium]
MTKSRNIVPIIMMIFLFGMISFVTNLASPMGDILKHQFTVANWVGALGVFANFIAYAVMGIPAGIMLDRWGYKRTALAAIAVGLLGVGIQTFSGSIGNSSAMIVYLLGAFVAGFSMCMLNTVVNPMLNNLGGGGNRGNQLIQIGGSFNSLAGTSVIIITGILIPNITQARISDVLPLMYTALGIFALAFIVIAIAKIPEKAYVAKGIAETGERSKYSALSFRHFVLGAVAVFIYVGIEVGIPNVLNKWLQNDTGVMKMFTGGTPEAIAASVAGTYWFLMLIGRLTGAIIARKVSAKKMLIGVSTLGLLLVFLAMFLSPSIAVNMPVFKGGGGSLFGFTQVPINAALLVLCGLCTSVMWGGIFNLAVEGLGKFTEKASGYFMVFVCGGGILPLLQNGIVDISGSYLVSYWVVVAGLVYLLYYALAGSKNVNKDIPVK